MLFVFQEDLRSWLLDPDCNDEYSVIHSGGEKVSILWNTPQESVLIRERAVSFPVIPSNKRKSGVGSGFCFFLFWGGVSTWSKNVQYLLFLYKQA